MSRGFDFHHSDGIFHLGALAIALTLGYIGLDKEIRGSLSKIDNILEHVKLSLIRNLQKADLIPDSNDSIIPIIDLDDGYASIFPTYWVYISCILVEYKFNLRKSLRFVYFFRRQTRIPLLTYFKSYCDLYVIFVLCLACILSFLMITGADLWGFDFFRTEFAIKCIYVLYGGVVLWLLFSLIMLAKLARINTVAERCQKEIDRHYQIMKKREMQRAQRDLDNTNS